MLNSRKQTKNKFIEMVWIKEREKELGGEERKEGGELYEGRKKRWMM